MSDNTELPSKVSTAGNSEELFNALAQVAKDEPTRMVAVAVVFIGADGRHHFVSGGFCCYGHMKEAMAEAISLIPPDEPGTKH